MRPGRATRGKWRTKDEKVGEWFVFKFGAPKVVAPACVDYGPHQLGLVDQALIMYWCIQDLWSPANLVASTVVEFDDTLPCLTDVRWDSVWATH
jgi:hypothetical protein